MFTLEQNILIVQCYFTNGERLENGELSYSTPRVDQAKLFLVANSKVRSKSKFCR
jgi:hypothetical protein